MKKKAMFKDLLMELKKSSGRFISIMLIVFLGTGFFVGVKATAPSMKKTASDYFTEMNLMDLELLSIVGFDDDDIAVLKTVDGIRDIMPSYSVDAIVENSSESEVFRIASIPGDNSSYSEINKLQLVEGRMPQSPNECVAILCAIPSFTKAIGTVIQLSEYAGDTYLYDCLSTLEFVVVGIVESPQFFSYSFGTTTVGSGYVDSMIMVPSEAFVYTRYTEVYVTLEREDESISIFSPEYSIQAKNLSSIVSELGYERFDAFIKKTESQLIEAQNELEEQSNYADEQLLLAKKELDDAFLQLLEAEELLANGWREYNEGYDEYERSISDALLQFEEGRKELEQGEKDYEDGLRQYQNALNGDYGELAEEARKELDEGWELLNQGKKDYEEGLLEYNEQYKLYEEGLKKYEEGLLEYTESLEYFETKVQEYNDGKAQYEEGVLLLQEAKEQYEQGLIDYENGLAELEQGKTDLWQGKVKYEKGMIDYEKGLEEYEKNEKLYLDSLAEYEEYLKTYEKGKAEYESAYLEFADAELLYQDARFQIDSGKMELEAGKTELAAAKLEYEDGQIKLAAGKAEYETGKKQYELQKAIYDLLVFENITVPVLSTIMDAAKKALDEAEQQLIAAEQEIAAAELQLANAEIDIRNAEERIANGERDLIKYEQELAPAEIEYEEGKILIKEAEAELKAGEAELKEAKAQLDDGKKQLDDGKKELEKAKKELEAAAKSIAEGEAEIAENQQVLDNAKKDLEAAPAQIEENEKLLEENLQLLIDGEQQIIEGQKELENAWIELEEGRIELEDGKRQLDEAAQQLIEAEEEIRINEEKLTQGEKDYREQTGGGLEKAYEELQEARKLLDEGYKEYEESLLLFEEKTSEAKKELDEAYITLTDGEIDLSENRKLYEDGLNEYLTAMVDAKSQISDGQKRIQNAKELIYEVDPSKWYALTRDDVVSSYSSFNDDANRIDAIAAIFPVFFMLVAALVCLTTMSRMVEEQRTQMGTYKALGYSSGMIMRKYVIYALIASIIGGILGQIVCLYIFPQVIVTAYASLYKLPQLSLTVQWYIPLISFVVALLCTVLVTLITCHNELKMSTAALMRPKAPKPGKKILIEKIKPLWKIMSFQSKITIRNLFRYKTRFIMTVIGIGGCMSLILGGFGLLDAISPLVDLQYGELCRYNLSMTLSSSMSSQGYVDMEQRIRSDDRIDESLFIRQSIESASNVDNTKRVDSVVLLVPQYSEKFHNVFKLKDAKSNDEIFLGKNDVIITEKMSKELSLEPGDSIIYTYGGSDYKMTITAVVKNYLYHYIYISSELYEKLFQEKPKFNSMFVVMDDYTASDENRIDNLVSDILKVEKDIYTITPVLNSSEYLTDVLSRLNIVIFILIISAGALAIVVVYNLTNINISERVREIATIKVLGFKNREVNMYVFRENLIMCVFGIIFGAIGGYFLAQFMIDTVEVDIVMFSRKILMESYIYATVLTVAFTVLVNFFMTFKMKKIGMVESLKAIE